MTYGPFKDYNTYKRALAKWNNSAKEKNEQYWEKFETDLTDAINDVLTDYYMKGCRYSERDVAKILHNYITDPDPFDFANLIDNEDDFEEQNYYEEKKALSPSEKRIHEREKYYKDMKKLFHK